MMIWYYPGMEGRQTPEEQRKIKRSNKAFNFFFIKICTKIKRKFNEFRRVCIKYEKTSQTLEL